MSRLLQLFSRPGDRREVMRGLAVVPLLGAMALPAADAAALPAASPGKKSSRARGKTQVFCLNKRTVKARSETRKRRLRRRGAKPGKCPCRAESRRDTCRKGCLQTKNNCGKRVNCGFVNVAPVTTFEAQLGTGTIGSAVDQLYNPYAVVASADMLVTYVGDYSNNRISVWTRPTVTSTDWAPAYQFPVNRPADIALSADELTMYIVEYNTIRFSIWSRPDAASQTWSEIGSFDLTPYGHPNSFTLSPDELTAWVTIFYSELDSQVLVLTRPDTSSVTWTLAAQLGSYGVADNQFQKPGDVAVSADARTIYVADYNNYRISIWSRPDTTGQDWSNIATFGNYGPNSDTDQFYRPISVTLSKDEQTLWIGDSVNNRISIWSRQNTTTQNWTYLSVFGGAGNNPDNLATPGTTWVSADESTIWVGDAKHHRVAIFSQTCPG